MKHILDKLTIKHLKLNKKRSVVTLIGMILSTILISGIITLTFSLQSFMIESEKEFSGNWQVSFDSLDRETYKYIDNDPYFTDMRVFSKNFGDILMEGSYFRLIAYNDEGFNEMAIKLESGRYPTNSNEVVLSDRYIDASTEKVDIGDTYIYEDKEYTVVGVAKNSNDILFYMNYEDYETFDVYLNAKNPKDIYENVEKIAKELNINAYGFHSSLLAYMGVGDGDEFHKFVMIVAAVLIFIVALGTASLIATSFSISIAERKKEVGILKSVGATSKQIMRSILKEGMLLFLIAVPIGLILTYGLSLVLSGVINQLLAPLFNIVSLDSKIEVIVDIKLIGISILFILVNVLLAVLIPSIKASKTSPIKVIKQTDDIKLSSKKLRVSKLNKKIFGVSGILAKKSIGRNRKRYIVTNIALTISIIILIVFSSFMQFTIKMTESRFTYNPFSIVAEKSISIDEYDKFLNDIDSVVEDDYSYTYYNEYSVEDKYLSEDAINYMDELNMSDPMVVIYALSDNNLESYYDKELKLGDALVVSNTIVNLGNKQVEIDMLNKDDDEFVFDGVNLNIVEYMDDTPNAATKNVGLRISLIVSNETMKSLFANREDNSFLVIMIESDNVDSLIESINLLGYSDLEVMDYASVSKVSLSIVNTISLFLYAFIFLLTAIAIANIFNVITSNIELKRREYINIKAMGASEKELKKMMFYESLLYILNALVYGTIIGVILSYLLYIGFFNLIEFNYYPPYVAIVIIIVVMVSVVLSTSAYLHKKILSYNLIDTMKDENI